MMEPKIRFKGFEGEWKDTVWGNHIVSTHTGTNLLGEVSNKGIPLLKMGNIQRGFFDLDKIECLAANQNPPINCIANYGDFFYNTRNTLELVGKGATWMKKDGIYAFNSNIAICKLDGIDTFFFNYLYNTLRSIKQVQARAKGTTSVAAVYMRDLKSIELALPHITEQQAIASYFTSLDSQISACTSRLASLKQMKAASLQAMFPQEGETMPKIRFKGFEGEWKKVVIGKIGSTYSGLSGKGKEDFGIGEAKYITFLNVLTNAQIDTSILENVNIKESEHQNEVKKGDLFFNTSSETPEEVGMCSVLDEEVDNVYLNSFCFGFRITNSCVYPKYIAYLMRSNVGRRIMSILAQGATRFNLSKKYLCKAEIPIPTSLAEQQAIASYFTSLDNQISLQTQRLEKLKQIKSACLDKMFV